MEFWEKSFIEKQAMWGRESCLNAKEVSKFFAREGLNDILIAGVGYGRNAKAFLDEGLCVTGIEISKTAIEMARKNGLDFKIHHGSVGDMPFDDCVYDGIYSHALLHLLNEEDRKNFISNCYNQLKPDGYMVFTTVSKNSPMYINGKKIDENNVENGAGVKLFFFDEESIEKVFGNFGLLEFEEIKEAHDSSPNAPSISFWVIKCKK